MNLIRALFFQDTVNPGGQLTGYGYDCLPGGDPRVISTFDAMVKLTQLRIPADGHPSGLDEQAAGGAVPQMGNRAPVDPIPGRVFGRH